MQTFAFMRITRLESLLFSGLGTARLYSVFFLEVKSSQELFFLQRSKKKELVLICQKRWMPAMQRDKSTDFISLEKQNLVARILHGA